MSPATVEKEKAEQALAPPLASFLTKLHPPAKPKEEKAEEKTVEQKTPEAKTIEGKQPDAKAEEKKPEDKKPDDKGTDDAATLEKRLKDTQKWAQDEHKRALHAERDAKALQERLDRIEQKLDGTYEAPKTPSPEQLTYDAEMRGKIRASHRAAIKKHGEEKVIQQVWDVDSPYQKLQAANPLIAQRVLASDDPVQEALDILQEEADAKKYGRTSEEMKRKIEEELKPKITQEILEGLKPKPGPATNTLGNVRGEAERQAQHADVPATLDFKRVFPHGASRT